jgi:hypothetical protein
MPSTPGISRSRTRATKIAALMRDFLETSAVLKGQGIVRFGGAWWVIPAVGVKVKSTP